MDRTASRGPSDNNAYPDLATALSCYMEEDHAKHMSALQCSECYPFVDATNFWLVVSREVHCFSYTDYELDVSFVDYDNSLYFFISDKHYEINLTVSVVVAVV